MTSRELRIVPPSRPRLAVSGNGTLATITSTTPSADVERVQVFELATGEPRGELEVPIDCDVGWLGGRVLAISGAELRALDPSIAAARVFEHRFDAAMRLGATLGPMALALGPTTAVIVASTATGLTVQPFPTRVLPSVAGAGPGPFLVTLGEAIEEWDPTTRIPKRRLRLAKPATVRALGGTARTVWYATTEQPDRIDVIAAGGQGTHARGGTSHLLPEPLVQIAGHPGASRLACIGESGAVYLVELEDPASMRVVVPYADAVAFALGARLELVVACVGQPVRVIAVDEDGAAPRSSSSSSSSSTAKPASTWRDELAGWTRRGGAMPTPAGQLAAIGERYELVAD
ncbi:MAG: hypothetical protein NT062_00005, partial [Proteobacteria bacterium]|nr:hypothetical protein [Pseudomonadota bacterium]